MRAEVLLRAGEPYSAQLASETERNLRKMFILATAVVLPVKARAPDAVSVLVVTKDLWSIRLNSEFSLVEGTLLKLYSSYSIPTGGAISTNTARLDNATNELYRNHLSLIKHVVPEMGRNFKVLYNLRF